MTVLAQTPPPDETVYEKLAEFHDLFMAGPWERLRPQVASAFAGLPAEAVIVEFGAGTGMGTRTIARESPARIAALEPSLVMRSVLTARVSDDPDLARRVTVVAGSVPAELGLLPVPCHGFVCANMLGHLDAEQRAALFGWIGAHLVPGGAGLVTTQERTSRPAGEFVESRSIGDYEYRARYRESARAEEFLSEYEVWRGDERIRSARFAGRWRIITAEDLAEELRGTGLEVESAGQGTVLIRRT